MPVPMYSPHVLLVHVLCAQKRALYTVHQPSHRTHLPLYFFALDVALVNAFILHETFYDKGELRDQRKFRLRLIDQILEFAGVDVKGLLACRRRVGSSADVPRVTHAVMMHMPRRFPDHRTTGGVLVPTRRQCVHCLSHGVRRETTMFCQGCDVALCVRESNCYFEYHEARRAEE
jgi:hypothetical protein